MVKPPKHRSFWLDLMPGIRRRVGSKLDLLLAPHFPDRYHRRYLAAIANEADTLPVPDGAPPLSMQRGYVPPLLNTAGEPSDPKTGWQMIVRSPRCLVLGCMGSGKSTLLRSLAWRLSHDPNTEGVRVVTLRHFGEAVDELTPVWVELRRYDLASHSLLDAMVSSMAIYGFPRAREFLLQKLESGECMILLDSLEALHDPRRRDELDELVEKYASNIWVVTARLGSQFHEPTKFTAYELQGMAHADVAQYVELCQSDPSGEGRALAQGLLAACARSEGLLDLASNPLMLISMCRAIRERSVRAPRLSMLCEACVQALLEPLAQDSSLTALEQRLPQPLLQSLALASQRRGGQSLERSECLSLIGERLEEEQLAGPDQAEHCFEILTDEMGVLCPEALLGVGHRYRFFRPMLCSYFAARRIVAANGTQELLEHVDDPLWTDTIALSAGLLADSSPLLSHIESEAQIEPDKWFLLARCLAEVARSDRPSMSEMRERIADHLYQLLECEGDSGLDRAPLWHRTAAVIAGMERTPAADYYRAMLLDRRNPENRRRAALALGRLGEIWAVPALGMAMADEEPAVAREAARALGRIPSRQAVHALPRALRSPHGEVREAAAWALAELGRRDTTQASVLSLLIDALHPEQGSPEDVASLAERALEAIGAQVTDHLASALDDPRSASRLTALQRGRMAKVLVNLGDERVLPTLIDALKSHQLQNAQALIDTVQGLGERAVPALIDALMGADNIQSSRLVAALGAIGAPAVGALIQAFGSNYPEVRTASLRALEAIGFPARDALIQALLHDEEFEVRRRALQVLRRIAAESPAVAGDVVFALVSALDDPDIGVRANAVRYLGELHDASAVPPLLVLAQDMEGTRPSLRRAAITSLGAIGAANPDAVGPAIPAMIALLVDPEIGETTLASLRGLGAPAVLPLIRALHASGGTADEPEGRHRQAIWSVLEYIGGSARPTDEGPLGLAATYAALGKAGLAPQAILDLTANLAWWEYGRELHQSLETAYRLGQASDLSEVSRCADAFGWMGDLETWLRPHVRRVLSDLRNVIDSAAIFHSLTRRQAGLTQNGRRDDLLNSRDALLSALRSLGETQGLVRGATLPFERVFFGPLIERWRMIVDEAARQLRGRALLGITLATEQLPVRNGTVVVKAVFRFDNRGDSIARNLSVTVGSRDVQVVTPGPLALESLGIGERRSIDVEIAPRGASRATLELMAQYDDDERTQFTQAFSAHIEFVDTPSHYTQIGRSPYIVGMPVKDPGMFYGRREVLAWVFENISSQHQEQSLLLYGELQLYGYVRNTGEFLYELAGAISRRLRQEGIATGEPSLVDFSVNAHRAFRDYCDELERHLGERRILVMMDEFGVLITKVHQKIFEASLFDYLRGLIQRSNRFNFLFTGAYEVRRMQQDFGSILFNMPKVYRISYLGKEETRRLIEEPVSGLLDYHPLVIEKIQAVTACHPYFVQYICNELLQLARKEQRNYVDLADLDLVTWGVVQDATGNIEHGIYYHLSNAERRVIAAAASLTDDVHVLVALDDLAERLDQHRLGMPREAILEALRALVERDLMYEERMGQTLGYGFRMGLIRLWLNQNETLLRLAQEIEVS
jgi:HEAT repeat protein